MPLGLTVKPDKNEINNFNVVKNPDGIEIYISKEIGTSRNELKVMIDYLGWFKLLFEQ